jgi:hypothetical protein
MTVVLPPPVRRRRWPVVLAVLVVAAAAAGVVIWQQRDDEVVAYVPPAPPPVVPQAPVVPAVEPPAAKPTDIQISVVTEPAGADVIVDGELVGKSPLDVNKPKGDHTLHVELRLASYETQSQDIKLDRDQRLVVAFVKEASKAVPAVKTRPVIKPKPKPKDKEDEFHRFD